ncbi:MAG TPA: c-type cytochrome [Rhodanobacteraceae bacterium]
MKHPAPYAVLAWLIAMPALAAAPQVTTSAKAPSRPSGLGLCAACHGTYGKAVMPNVPNLAGQNLDYLLKAIKDYRSGKRDVAVMKAAVGPLSWKQLEALARWFAAQPAGGAKAGSGGHP